MQHVCAFSLVVGLGLVCARDAACLVSATSCQSEQDSGSDNVLLQTHVLFGEPGPGSLVEAGTDDIEKAAQEIVEAGKTVAGSVIHGIDVLGVTAVRRLLDSISGVVESLSEYVGIQVKELQTNLDYDTEDAEGAIFRERTSFEAMMQETLAGVLVSFAGIEEGIAQMQQEMGDTLGDAAQNIIGPSVRMAKRAIGPLVKELMEHVKALSGSIRMALTSVQGISEVEDRRVFKGRLEDFRKSLSSTLPEADIIASKLVGQSRAVAAMDTSAFKSDTELEDSPAEMTETSFELEDVEHAQLIGRKLRAVVSTLVSGLTATFVE